MQVELVLEKAVRLQNEGDAAQAEKLYAKALKSVRDNPAIWFNHGLTLRDLGEHYKALASFDQAQRLSPPMAEIENERANALLELGRHDESLAAAQRALALGPHHAGALITRGLVLMTLAQLEAALADFDAALRLEPRMTLAWINRGVALDRLGHPAEALASFGRALALDPQNSTALNLCGALLAKLGRFEDALAHYDRALAGDPTLGVLHLNRATVLAALKRLGEAHGELKRLYAEHPDNPSIFDALLDTSLRSSDFAQLSRLEGKLEGHIRAGHMVAPYRVLLCSDEPELQRMSAQTMLKSAGLAHMAAMPPRRAACGRRLKVAYLSHDFRDHAVAVYCAALIESHDRERFETFAVSTGPDDASAMRQRLGYAFEHFAEARAQDDETVARALAQADIDILVDLGAHTSGWRPGIAARRPAPVQVSYLGWPATTGAAFFDYMIADPVVAPPGRDGDFTEKLVRLPHCYHATDPGRDPFGAIVTRAEVGLPEGAFVFCAFNGVFKITPPVFRTWMALLHEVGGSVLWLRQSNDLAERNLRREAAELGIAPERLVFAGNVSGPEHIARHRLADLFVDTMPFAGHSTAIEALWAGLPLVTCAGTSFVSRVSASALAAIGMPELAAATLPDYQTLALKLARDPALLASYRERLDAGRRQFPLFDVASLARALESAYETMAQRSRAGLQPEAFTVSGA